MNNTYSLDTPDYWLGLAKNILKEEKARSKLNKPEPIRILVEWRDDTYIGSLQEIAPDFSKEIVLLSKSSNPIPGNLASAIKALDQDRLELQADDSLDLDGRQQVLRKLENRLEHMTPEQTEYTIS